MEGTPYPIGLMDAAAVRRYAAPLAVYPASPAAHALLVGNGSSALDTIPPGVDGAVLVSDSGAWIERALIVTDIPDLSSLYAPVAGGGYQPLDADLTAIAALAPADGAFIRRTGGVWVGAALQVADIPDLSATYAALATVPLLSPVADAKNVIQAVGAFRALALKASATGTPNLLDLLDNSGNPLVQIGSIGNYAYGATPDTRRPMFVNVVAVPATNEVYQGLTSLVGVTPTVNTTARIWGLHINSAANGSGNVQFIWGMDSEAFAAGSGNITSVKAGVFSAYLNQLTTVTSTVSALTGLEVNVGKLSGGAGNATNAYGIIILTDGSGSGTLTNFYGLKIADVTAGGTLNYAIFTGAGLVHFGGALELGENAAPATPAAGGRLFFDTSHRFSWKGANGFIRTFDGTANLADRIYVLPDADGTVILDTATQTLTNKTLTTPTIGSFVNANHTHTNAASGGVLAYLSSTPPVVIGTAGANTAELNVNAAASVIGQIIRANATTPGDLLQLQDSAGNVLLQGTLNTTGVKISWMNITNDSAINGFAWKRAGAFETRFYPNNSTGAFTFADWTSGAEVVAASFPRALSGTLSLGYTGTALTGTNLTLGNAGDAAAYIIQGKRWGAGTKRDALAFGTFETDGNSQPTRLTITTSNVGNPGIADVRIDNAQLIVNGLATVVPLDAGTSAVLNVEVAGHNSSGTPAAGFGAALDMQLHSSTTINTDAARLRWYWNTATHATRKAYAVLSAFDTAERDVIGWGASGTVGLLGFFAVAAAPVVVQVDGAALVNNAVASGTTNQIDDFTSLTIYATDAQAIHNDIYQLARKVKIIDDALRAYGLLT